VPARPTALARAWQIASAPARPPRLPVCVVEVTNAMFGGGAKLAVAVAAAATVITQVPVPVQPAPDQPVKTWPPAVGVAVSVTVVP
jgi:hypothetical protein